MARPTTREELLRLGETSFNHLFDIIATMPNPDVEFPKGTMNRNVRDILAHLHYWHLLFLSWYEIGMGGQKPIMPEEGYSWKDTPELNKKIWLDAQCLSLPEVMISIEKSYAKIRNIIGSHTNEELFEKRRYKWTGSTSLGSYLISATSSHYDWAIKLIKKTQRT